MVGILLLTHAPLGQAFIAAVAHVFRGPTERFEAIDVAADQDIGEVNGLARQAIARLDEGDGVLVITDVKGGTPSNCCNSLADAGHVCNLDQPAAFEAAVEEFFGANPCRATGATPAPAP